MNTKQRAIISVGMVGVLVAGLFPPFRTRYPDDWMIGTRIDFSFILSPPVVDGAHVGVDLYLISVELVVIVLLVVGGVLIAKD